MCILATMRNLATMYAFLETTHWGKLSEMLILSLSCAEEQIEKYAAQQAMSREQRMQDIKPAIVLLAKYYFELCSDLVIPPLKILYQLYYVIVGNKTETEIKLKLKMVLDPTMSVCAMPYLENKIVVFF